MIPPRQRKMPQVRAMVVVMVRQKNGACLAKGHPGPLEAMGCDRAAIKEQRIVTNDGKMR